MCIFRSGLRYGSVKRDDAMCRRVSISVWGQWGRDGQQASVHPLPLEFRAQTFQRLQRNL
jgi:hypothetical protein